ncbi:hypothetical protein SAMN04487911_10221 [Arenibacter nanhaiticus]|uniref:Uncharacterized protein n=1 Tax=Arenibacter nanhaiticus TaxID=558155 RepID=A0A1M6B091_9FLAO|nr:hypothetical protein SAMN04487911_10221 [Arenibacter nanhaiticus]
MFFTPILAHKKSLSFLNRIGKIQTEFLNNPTHSSHINIIHLSLVYILCNP